MPGGPARLAGAARLVAAMPPPGNGLTLLCVGWLCATTIYKIRKRDEERRADAVASPQITTTADDDCRR
jgi:hypothetical protein